MLQESVEDLLRKFTVEREPLSEAERREVMEVSKKIRLKVMRMAGDEEHSEFFSDISNQRISLWKGESVKDHKSGNLETNLVIVVADMEKTEGEQKRLGTVSKYYFTPVDVTETILNLNGVLSNTKDDFSAGDLIRPDIAEIQFLQGIKLRLERTPQEIFHPGKTDLEGLLISLFSATPFRHRVSRSG